MPTASLTSPEDFVNAALVRIGSKLRISNIYDGSVAANQSLAIYGQTRDELLRQNDWGFAERNVALTLLKQAPAGGYTPPTTWDPAIYPPLPWAYEYTYPDDCLKVRAVKDTPILIPVYDPRPNIFEVVNDNDFVPARKVLLCNVADAILVYSGRITNPSTWEADFSESLVAALGRRMPSLASPEMIKIMFGDEAGTKAMAEGEQG